MLNGAKIMENFQRYVKVYSRKETSAMEWIIDRRLALGKKDAILQNSLFYVLGQTDK